MAFKKGISGNPGGRPKGTANKKSTQLRETITAFLENNFERVVIDFEELTARDRVKFYCDLLQYGLPRLQTVQLETDINSIDRTTFILPNGRIVEI